jgi:hypothetical protein
VGGEGRLHGKPSITADPGRAGHAYVVWSEYLTPLGPPPEGISFSRTTDGGETWSPPMHLNFPTPPGTNPQGALVDVLPDGSLLALTTVRAPNGSSEPHRVYTMRSSDQGATWTPPSLVTEFPATDGRHSTPFSDPETGENVDAPEWAISSAVTPAGTVYVTWRHRTSPDAAEIRVTKSSDGGRTWAAPITVASSGSEMFLPVVAVASDGTVGVTYYDERRDLLGSDGYTADFWFAHSHDGGATWQERHVAGPFDLRTALYGSSPCAASSSGTSAGWSRSAAGSGLRLRWLSRPPPWVDPTCSLRVCELRRQEEAGSSQGERGSPRCMAGRSPNVGSAYRARPHWALRAHILMPLAPGLTYLRYAPTSFSVGLPATSRSTMSSWSSPCTRLLA